MLSIDLDRIIGSIVLTIVQTPTYYRLYSSILIIDDNGSDDKVVN